MKIKRQNGASPLGASSKLSDSLANSDATEKSPMLIGRQSQKADEEGYYRRKISRVGNFKLNKLTYHLDLNRAGQEILIQITENVLRVYDLKKILLGTLDKRKGKKYS